MTRPHSRRSWRLLLVAFLAVATLTGCGLPQRLAGVTPAPEQVATVAPLGADHATRIAARVLDAADEADRKSGDAAAAARQAVLTGTALAAANGRVAMGTATPSSAQLSRPEPPKLLAMSRGQAFPRLLLATNQDPQSRRQYLDLLVSPQVTAPFKLSYRVPMMAGASLPATGDVGRGIPMVAADNATGLVLSPKAAVEGYAAALGTPDPSVGEHIDAGDSFATALKASQSTQSSALGSLASLKQSHTLAPDTLYAVRLAGGDVLVFAQFDRADVITASANTKELKVPEALQKLTGSATATSSMTINAVEAVALLIPAQGKVKLLGATDQLVSGSVQ